MTETPSVVVVFFGEQKTLRVKFEGVREILEGMKRFVHMHYKKKRERSRDVRAGKCHNTDR